MDYEKWVEEEIKKYIKLGCSVHEACLFLRKRFSGTADSQAVAEQNENIKKAISAVYVKYATQYIEWATKAVASGNYTDLEIRIIVEKVAQYDNIANEYQKALWLQDEKRTNGLSPLYTNKKIQESYDYDESLTDVFSYGLEVKEKMIERFRLIEVYENSILHSREDAHAISGPAYDFFNKAKRVAKH